MTLNSQFMPTSILIDMSRYIIKICIILDNMACHSRSTRIALNSLSTSDLQRLQRSYVLLWYLKETSENRSSGPVCLTSHTFSVYAKQELLLWKSGDIVRQKIGNTEFQTLILYVGNLKKCLHQERNLTELMEKYDVVTDNVARYMKEYESDDSADSVDDQQQQQHKQNIEAELLSSDSEPPKELSKKKQHSNKLKRTKNHSVHSSSSDSEQVEQVRPSKKKQSKKTNKDKNEEERRKLSILREQYSTVFSTSTPRRQLVNQSTDQNVNNCGEGMENLLRELLVEQRRGNFLQEKTNRLLSQLVQRAGVKRADYEDETFTDFLGTFLNVNFFIK